MAKSKIKWQITLFLLFVFLGLLLSVKFSNEGYTSYLERQDQEDLLTLWRDLETKQDSLQEELKAVQEQKQALTQEVNADSTAMSNMAAQRETLYKVNGLVEVNGPGIEVFFPGDTPLLYLDLVDLINELWASGAEAVSVNNERVTVQTAFYFTETDSGIFLTANKKVLHYPLSIKAVGDANMLERGLTFPGGIVDSLGTLYNIKPSIKKSQKLQLPANESPNLDINLGWISGSRTFIRE